jgi:hypothetical protein
MSFLLDALSTWCNAQWRSLERNGVAMVLVAVGLVHATRVWRSDLTQWKGGGFGMFSTVDSGASRRLHVRFEVNGRQREVGLPIDEELADMYRLTKRLPSTRNLAAFAETLARSVWTESDPLRHEDTCDDEHPPEACWLRGLSSSLQERTGGFAEQPLESPLFRFHPELLDGVYVQSAWRSWRPGEPARGRLRLLDSITVTLDRTLYSIQDACVRREEVRSVTRPGLAAAELSTLHQLPPEFLAHVWGQAP